MNADIADFASWSKHEAADSAIVIVLSHGTFGAIIGTDGKLVDVDQFVKKLNGKNCPALNRKPKIFILNACRGKETDLGVPDRPTSSNEPYEESKNVLESVDWFDSGAEPMGKTGVNADILVAYSSAPGYYSYRNDARGSRFVQALLLTLGAYAWCEDILHLLTRVTSLVTHLMGGDHEVQTPHFESSLSKIFYFIPRPKRSAPQNLSPILKNIYVEDPEVTAVTDDEVAVKLDLNNVAVLDLCGDRKPPNPVETFLQAFRAYPEIMKQIELQNFRQPTPIQCQMWPLALSGFDVIGISQTGTGKTLGFLLPMFIHLEKQPGNRKREDGPGAVVLTPTRELAQQIEQEVEKYRYEGIKSVCIYGGAGTASTALNATIDWLQIVKCTGNMHGVMYHGSFFVHF